MRAMVLQIFGYIHYRAASGSLESFSKTNDYIENEEIAKMTYLNFSFYHLLSILTQGCVLSSASMNMAKKMSYALAQTSYLE